MREAIMFLCIHDSVGHRFGDHVVQCGMENVLNGGWHGLEGGESGQRDGARETGGSSDGREGGG